MTTYYDPYAGQISNLQSQIGTFRAQPHSNTTPNGGVPWQTDLQNMMNQLSSLQSQSQHSQAMPKLNAPDAMPSVSTMPSFVTADPLANFGTDGQFYTNTSFNPAPSSWNGQSSGASPQNAGPGKYTTGITDGIVPQSAIDQASATLKAPVPNPFGGALGNQLADYTRGTNAAENVDMTRSAAAQQAKMNLTRQSAQANAGINWSDLLARLNESATNAKNAVAQPLVGSVLNALQRQL